MSAWETTKIDHPQVATCTLTCAGAPTQYEGTLADGRIFYFRYRFGHADLGFGATLDEAVEHSIRNTITIGEQYDSEFESAEHRDQVFAELHQAAEDARMSA